MNGFHRGSLGALLALAFALASCLGTESGNPPLRVSLVADTTGTTGGVTVDTVYVTLKEARFSQGTNCSEDGPVITAPPYANLLPPTVFDLVLPTGAPTSYCRVKLEIARAEPPLGADVPPELADNDVLVAGRRADGRRFRVLSRMDREVFVMAVAGTFAGDATTHSTVLAMDVGRWLSGVDLDSAPVDASGVAVVDDSVAPAQAAIFDANFATSFAVYQDTDGNGELDSTERAHGPIAHD